MDLIWCILVFVLSMAALVKASDWFVVGAEAVGLSLGISPFVIGVTLVAFGTSLPELAASIAGVVSGSSEIVVGNVVGSNITNILLVVGISAVIGREIIIDKESTSNNLLMLLASAFLMYFTLQDGDLEMVEACLYLVGMVFFITGTIKNQQPQKVTRPTAHWAHYLMMIGGAVLVYAGAHFTIQSMNVMSEQIGVSNEIIALTGVAFGTSLPEVMVSVTAIRKGKSDIAIGNVLGSNIFNSFAVMGIPGLMGELVFKKGALYIPQSVIDFSLPLMIASTILFAFMFTESRVSRWEGWILVTLYIFFIYMTFTP